MSYIRTEDNVRLFVEDLNPSGVNTIVFVHGWPFDHRMFEYQTNILPAYGYRCVSFDIRGFGRSDRPWDDYSYTRIAGDIKNIVEKLRLGSFVLAGFSMGGAIAIRYMTRYAGEHVTKLALLSAAAPSFVKRPGYNIGMDVASANALIAQIYHDRPQMAEDFGNQLFAGPVSDALKNWFTVMALDASGHGSIMTLELLRDEDLRHELFGIQTPTGIFHGMKDRICPFAFAQMMNAQIGGSVLFAFENSGHAIFYDELDRFNDSFLKFLQS